jgi:Tfp pilus assembly protein PilF
LRTTENRIKVGNQRSREMNKLLGALACWACLALAACTTAPPAASVHGLFDDALFGQPSETPRAEDVFALSDAMKRHIGPEFLGQLRIKGLQRGLVDALYTKGDLRLEYDAQMTRNAAQAYDARSGNCLSLVIMTAAFARHLGIPVTYRSVYTENTWSRSGDLYFSSGHVNLSLGTKRNDSVVWSTGDWQLTIDFVPPEDLRGQRALSISEDTIIAMYMNNRAAESLAQGRLDDAYHWARAAVRHAPNYLGAHNTLGVVYLRSGHPAHAERVFAQVLAREPDNTLVMSNQVRALAALGRGEESAHLSARLARIEPHPPFHFFDLGMARMRAGEYEAARALFTREVQRAAYYHEFHFWLAMANLRLGNVAQARLHMGLAEENSTTRNEQAIYAAKLDLIRQRRLQ